MRARNFETELAFVLSSGLLSGKQGRLEKRATTVGILVLSVL